MPGLLLMMLAANDAVGLGVRDPDDDDDQEEEPSFPMCAERHPTPSEMEELMWRDRISSPELDVEAQALTWEPSLVWTAFFSSPVITVQFVDQPRQRELESKVKEIVRDWEDEGPVEFQFVDPGGTPADVRVSFRESGCWSYVGREAKSKPAREPTMNLCISLRTHPDELRRLVLHEFGHALGFIHEHQGPSSRIKWRKDRVYAHFLRKNRWSRKMVDTEVLDRKWGPGTQFTDFDPESIMIYAIPPELTEDGYSVPWNSTLSKTDKRGLLEAYEPEHTFMLERHTREPCGEEPLVATLFNTGPLLRNEVFANGIAVYVIGPRDRNETVRTALSQAVTEWARVLKTHKAIHEPEMPEVYRTRFAQSPNFRLFIPPQVVTVRCRPNATLLVRWTDGQSKAFKPGVVALARVKGRTILLNGKSFSFKVGGGDQDLPLERVLLHELGHAVGLVDEDDPTIESVMQPTLARMASKVTQHDATRFIDLLRQTVSLAAPGVLGENCAGLRLE